jgi:acid phosphatase
VRTSQPWRSAPRGLIVTVAVVAVAVLADLTGCGGDTAHHPVPHMITTTRVPPSALAPAGATTLRTSGSIAPVADVPRPAHIVIVVMENRSYSDLIDDRSAPFINSLAGSGALFTQSFAIAHPSEPNYLALFSGSTQGLSADSCPHEYRGSNLAAELLHAGDSFAGYAGDLPGTGYLGCSSGAYARKHVPWANLPGLPGSLSRPFTEFPTDYTQLPTLSFVIPNLDHDMHNGTVAQADQWLQRNLGRYAQWATVHNSMLVLTWDEDDRSELNRIPTIVTGASIRPGRYSEHVTHYRLLRTLEACEGLPPIGHSMSTTPITDIWAKDR